MPEYVKKKILLLGDGAVGKTSLIRRFVVDKFSDNYIATIGTKVTKKDIKLKVNGEDYFVSLMIWDVLGQKGYSAVQASSFRGSQGAMMVYDLTRPETLQSLEEYWIPQIFESAGKIPLVMVGNKVDLIDRRKSYEEDAKEFSDAYEAQSYLSSAKSGENVEKIFRMIGKEILEEKRVEEVEKSVEMDAPPSIVRASDKIIMDFCNQFGGLEAGMPIVREQFIKAGVNIKNPTKEGLIRAVNMLAEVEMTIKDHQTVTRNRNRRLALIRGAR
ncbi:MAG: GTP-binding protein [Methanobacteriota archaeon]|nr:MAG: GTP-binding protein [Euryarchaeota archaeon]